MILGRWKIEAYGLEKIEDCTEKSVNKREFGEKLREIGCDGVNQSSTS